MTEKGGEEAARSYSPRRSGGGLGRDCGRNRDVEDCGTTQVATDGDPMLTRAKTQVSEVDLNLSRFQITTVGQGRLMDHERTQRRFHA